MTALEALAAARDVGHAAVLVTVIEVGGDAPSHAGAKLVVTRAGDVAGSLGCSEFDAAGRALADELLAPAAAPSARRTLRFPGHGQDDRAIEVFAERYDPPARVVVVGDNPVGRCVAQLAEFVGRRVELVDAPPLRKLTPADAVVISDHDAPWVDEVLRTALRSAASYVGMLGSRRHAPTVVARLEEAGLDRAHIARLRAPVGHDLGGKTPELIALSVVAEIVAEAHGRPGGPIERAWLPT